MAQFYFIQHCVQHATIGRVHPPTAWHPTVDVYRCADGWLLKFELADVRRDDIEVQFDGHGVRVSGVRRESPLWPRSIRAVRSAVTLP